MNKTSEGGFVHSIKVPRIYKTASVIVKKVVEEGGSLKNLVYGSSHKNIKGIYALVVKTIQHNQELDRILTQTKILKNETRLQPWLAKILITELLFGKKELKVKKPRYVRVNTLHYTPDEIIKKFRNEGWIFIPPPSDYCEFLKIISNLKDDSFTRDFHIKELLVFPNYVQFYENELYQNSDILLQDKASCLATFLLKPGLNSVTLDMCAAPGMKTTHLSAITRNSGKVYATEINSDRYQTLCDVVKNAGCKNVITLNIDALTLNTENEIDTDWCNDVEYILVDPSCSGTGISERVNLSKNDKPDYKRLKKLCGFQFKLLLHALTKFPKVKRVVYSTCSMQPEENEKVIEDVINKLNEYYSESTEKEQKKFFSKFRLAEPLKETWPHRGSNDFQHGNHSIFANPESDLTNGFFIAVFERIENGMANAESDKEIVVKKKKN